MQLENLDLVKTALDIVINSVLICFVTTSMCHVKLGMIKETGFSVKTGFLTQMDNYRSNLHNFKIHILYVSLQLCSGLHELFKCSGLQLLSKQCPLPRHCFQEWY
ncbi:hypothetical protein ILYODFUR_031459 [Ilyodon furcidens]|uniref:Uncharacterized protein n=1 Tax=Ilyodon furcidens TaxID=33524 RepID=A0ABV0VL69_9TELE